MDAFQSTLSDQDFLRLSRFIYSNYGIKMPDSKRNMLQARLQRRLRARQMESFKDYCDLLFSGADGLEETIHMIDVVSTNKTDFFRESNHFEFMRAVAIQDLTSRIREPLKIWSAGCSSGEEAYTIAMVLKELERTHRYLDFSILGTDISLSILKRAANAIYTEERIAGIPMDLKRKYFLKSRDEARKEVRIIPALRNKTRFLRLNFMDPSYDQVPKDFDIIFCRNVLIYFDKPTQEQVISKLCRHLKPGGYFFLGHSETIMEMQVPLKQLRPTVYQKVH